jgi:hypothetical protein
MVGKDTTDSYENNGWTWTGSYVGSATIQERTNGATVFDNAHHV